MAPGGSEPAAPPVTGVPSAVVSGSSSRACASGDPDTRADDWIGHRAPVEAAKPTLCALRDDRRDCRFADDTRQRSSSPGGSRRPAPSPGSGPVPRPAPAVDRGGKTVLLVAAYWRDELDDAPDRAALRGVVVRFGPRHRPPRTDARSPAPQAVRQGRRTHRGRHPRAHPRARHTAGCSCLNAQPGVASAEPEGAVVPLAAAHDDSAGHSESAAAGHCPGGAVELGT